MNQTTNDLNELAALHDILIAQTKYLSVDSVTQHGGVQIKQPWIDEPSGSIPIDVQNGLAMPAVAAGTWIQLITFTSPDGWDSIIDGLNLNVTTNAFTDFSGDLIWQLRIDSRPVDGFQAILNQRGSVQQPRRIHTLQVKSNSIIEIMIQHPANGLLAGNCIAGLFGYRYPRIG